MNRRTFLLAGAAILSALAANPESKGARLIIHLHYTGSGTVDALHKPHVASWDSPDFVKNNTGSVQSFAVVPVISKSGVAQFEGIQKNPVYVSRAYDPTGTWRAKSEPAVATSLGRYAQQPGMLAHVEL